MDDFPRHVLTELRQLVTCKRACYAELDYTRKRSINVFDPPQAAVPEWFAQLIQDHPVLNYFKASGDGQALKISDFLGVREFHQLPIYREAFRLTNVEDELGFGVQCETRFILGFAFHRGERSFTEADRLLLNLIRPHIIQAYLHLEELAGHEQLQHDLQTALRENGLGVIIVNDRHAVIHATPGTFEKLASYVPVPAGQQKLPEALAQWAFNDDGNSNGEPFTVSRDGARLIIRRVRQSDRRLLLLSEENSTAAAERLAQYHLTPRELEVLHWLAAGKANAEIGVILGVSVGTAKMHVEHILAKLGVENRTAAAAYLRSVGL
jgi:DNA-binding CsgD family transcriptional regulator